MFYGYLAGPGGCCGIGLAVCKRRERQDPISKAEQQGLELCAVVVVLEEGGVWVSVIKLTILHQSCTGADFLITRKAARILSSFFFFSFFLSNVYERGHGSVLAMKNGGN